MSKFKILLAIIISLTLLQCSQRSNPTNSYEQPIDLPAVEKKLVNSNNEFGLKLFREINQDKKDSNVFISPLSVSMVLGMTYNGADGDTKEAMHQTLDYGDLSTEEINQCYKHLINSLTQLDPTVDFQIANSIWYCLQGRNPKVEFIDLCQSYFDALVRGFDIYDPHVEDTINACVEENTNGRIKKILNGVINPVTLMFLINAIYFKGAWTYRFDKEFTQDSYFWLPDGSYKICKMMKQKGLFKYFENDAFEALDLPYGECNFSMTIFLPYRRTDIDSLIVQFNQNNLNQWLDSLSNASLNPNDSINIYIPKFKLEFESGLNNLLTTLGMGIAFDPGNADFSKMYEIKPMDPNVWIDTVLHKTFIEVNEEGTEAAAVAVSEMIEGPSFYFKANRPFIFMIREHQSQTILFIGKITDPNYE